ncbi:MAG: serine hydrolase domain-containing protein, partial [Balneolaceae bacterium]
MRKKIIVGTILLVGVISAVFFVRSDLHRVYLPTASGIMAKQVCSLHFVSGFSHEEARTLYLDPLADDFAGLIFSDIRVSNREVYASIIGLYRQTAVFREGIGCSLVHDGRNFDRTLALPPARVHKPLSIDYFHRASHFDTLALESALNTNFIQSNRNTLAIVVLNKGHLIAERYADGITPATPLHGWSMAKSLTATLAGAMVHRGEIELDEKGIVNNSRLHELTLDHLLRMNTGLDITETSDGWDPNSKMLFTQADMADWASHRDMLHKPGEKWEYMSGNTILAMRAMQNRLGETLDEQLAGLRERVFEPLDIYSAIFETDEAGTLQGSSYMYATAHDWARLGQLYLNRG